jgi:hypothetical protein
MKLTIHALELDKEILPLYLHKKLYDFRINFETKKLTATLEGTSIRVDVQDLSDFLASTKQPVVQLNTAEIILNY